jgi:hypothetical protein
MRLMLRLQDFVALNVAIPVFSELCALILIKNYQLVANLHVSAVQSWHLRGVPQAVEAVRSVQT